MKSENKQLFNNNINDNTGSRVSEHSLETLERDKSRCTVYLEEINSRVSEHSSETLEPGLPGFTKKKNKSQKPKNIILKINKIHSTFIEEFLLDSF